MASRDFDKLFNKLAAAEDAFLRAEFLAPVLVGGEVRVRVAGVVCLLQVTPADFEGWGVFRPTSHTTAELVRVAGLAERRRYLELFPTVRLVLSSRDNSPKSATTPRWWGMPAHAGDGRFQIAGLVPVRLADEVQQFDVVRTRFDGGCFWFDDLDPSRSPATAAWLRKCLNETIPPNQLERSGLTPEEKAAYAVNFFEKEEVRQQLEAEKQENRLQAALKHAGAELVDFMERRDGYRVTYRLGGRQHVSSVNKDDLTVQVAGICLSGLDRQFDLASLVGVIREGEGDSGIVRVGHDNGGMDEGDYWDVHPPGDGG